MHPSPGPDRPLLTRRRLLRLGLALPLPLAACDDGGAGRPAHDERTRDIHVKVQAPNRPVLTTQLYFPGEPRNATDGLFRQELLEVRQAAAGRQARFGFVLDR